MSEAPRTRSALLIALGAVFLLVATGLLGFALAPALLDYWRIQHWPATPGRLLDAGLETSRDSEGTRLYRATARYQYEVGGHTYTGNRVAIDEGRDNIGRFQQELARRLEAALHAGRTVPVHYDPEHPERAVLDRSFRGRLFLFRIILIVLFGGAGGLMFYLGWHGAPREESPPDAPWLGRKAWRNNRILSTARFAPVFPWVFTIGWNLMSIPFWLEIGDGTQTIPLPVTLLMAVIGLGTLVWALRATWQWKRFGPTPLTLDPFPGAIGGDVGGSIEASIPYRPDLRPRVVLRCIHRRDRKHGQNRSVTETVRWENDGLGRVEPTPDGIRIDFRLAVPEGLPPSEPPSDDYHLWRFHLYLEQPGLNLERDYEIPVYSTGAHSRLSLDSAHPDFPAVPSPERLLPLSHSHGRMVLRYPMLRHGSMALIQAAFGALFVLVGILLWQLGSHGDRLPRMMSFLFGGIGLLILAIALYTAFQSLEVILDGRTGTSLRRWLGWTVQRRHFSYAHVRTVEAERVAMRPNAVLPRYRIIARVMGQDRPAVLAEDLKGRPEAERAAAFFRRELGLDHQTR